MIFDFDGVLVNSEPLHYTALRDSLAPEGITLTIEEYLRTYLAYDDRSAIRLALQQHRRQADPDRVALVAERKARVFEALKSEVPLFPGARALVRALAAEMPVAIASGALHHEIESILDGAGLLDAFAAIVGADDVARTKPHPEPYLTAMGRIEGRLPGLVAGECVVVEDSMPGIASGLAAGMKVLGVAHTYTAEHLGTAHHVVPALDGVDLAALRRMFG